MSITETDRGPAGGSNALVRLLGQPDVPTANAPGLPRKALVIVALLDSTRAGRLTRAALAARLWPDMANDQATANLRQLLLRLRHWQTAEGVSLIKVERQMVSRDDTCLRSDLKAFLQLASIANETDAASLLDLYRGEFLSSFEEVGELSQWIEERRSELRDRFVGLALTGGQTVGGHLGIQLLGRAFEEAPYDDAVVRAYVLELAREGDTSAIRRTYTAFASRLRRDLQDEPRPETTLLVRELLPDRTLAWPAAADVPEATVRGVPRLLILPPGRGTTRFRRSDEILAMSLIDEVTHHLARARTFAVFAPHTARLLGERPFPGNSPYRADYVLTTELSPHDDTSLRLIARLTRVSTHEVLFSEELRFRHENLGRRHSDLVAGLALQLANGIERSELARYRMTGAASSYVHYLLGVDHMRTMSLGTMRRARRHLRHANVLSRNFAPAMSMMARAMCIEWVLLDRTEPDLIEAAVNLARKASMEDPLDPAGYRELGHALIYRDALDEAVEQLENALDRGPHHADVLTYYADVLVHIGRSAEAQAPMAKALELNPLAPDNYYWIGATADFFSGDFAGASRKLAAMQRPEAAARLVAAVEALHGDLERAHRFRDIYMAEHPDFVASNYSIPLRRKEDRDRYHEALRIAGFH